MSEPVLRVIDRLEVLICGLDPHGIIQLFNEPCERVTGLTKSEAIGRSWLDLFASGLRTDQVRALWSQVRGNSSIGPFEALCRNHRNLRWQFSAHGDEVLPEVSLWAVGIDVTAEREALVRAREIERTRMLGNLVSGLTHELRNPLNGLLLQLAVADRILVRRHDDELEPVVAAIAQASAEARRTAAILEDFLVVARPQPITPERTDIRRVVGRAIERAARRANAAGVVVSLDAGADIVAEVDGPRVESAVYQLIANAVDAASESFDRTAIVRLSVLDNSVVIEVEDHGSGISGAEGALFEPFFTTKTGGTGLGLAIVQRVAMDHEGAISHTRRGDSTVFRLELPILPGVS